MNYRIPYHHHLFSEKTDAYAGPSTAFLMHHMNEMRTNGARSRSGQNTAVYVYIMSTCFLFRYRKIIRFLHSYRHINSFYSNQYACVFFSGWHCVLIFLKHTLCTLFIRINGARRTTIVNVYVEFSPFAKLTYIQQPIKIDPCTVARFSSVFRLHAEDQSIMKVAIFSSPHPWSINKELVDWIRVLLRPFYRPINSQRLNGTRKYSCKHCLLESKGR